ncbi:MAG TPA: retropepsin-like aspartic protease, partial [Thermoanaerobaculia bacterium]|nr:retropepsin-like aspartic protease [Thermoanaerobaculia bacterium]
MTRRRRRRLGEIAAVVLFVTPLACRLDGDRKVAGRILDRYRRATGAKPLPASHVIRMRLSSESPGGGTGVAEVAWEPNRFRERIASAGATTERGIQGGKAYFVDEDGVTRVGSEPVLRELLARSYFWRRAWLFADQSGARLSLGPADPSSVSVRLQPFGSNPLLLSFSRRDGRLISVRSPRFDLDFAGERSFREAAGRRPPVRVEIAWAGLPTGSIEDATVGGGCGRFEPAAGLVDFERTPGGGIAFPARVNGAELRFALDADADGPPSISAERAASLSLHVSRDVYGRLIASGATLEVGGFTCRGIHIEVGSAPEGADGVIGGTLFREAVVELDPKSGRLGLHDPAKWASPAGFNRILVDDDGNRPVTTLRRGREVARLRAGSATGASDLRLAPASAARLDVKTPGVASELRWGTLALPPLEASSEA